MDKITRDELYEFWSQIADQSFDSRLQIFFDMYALNKTTIKLILSNNQSTNFIIIKSLAPNYNTAWNGTVEETDKDKLIIFV